MNTALPIVVTSLLGSAFAGAAALLCARFARPGWIAGLVSFAVGALLGVAFLEILPQLLRGAVHSPAVLGATLFGILGFFVLEKLFVWRHHHGGQGGSEHDAHEVNARPRGAALILIGSVVHSLFDGFFIAVTYMAAPRLGVLSAFALFVHEFAQQLGDAATQSSAGTRLRHALLICGATVAGALLGYRLIVDWPGALALALGGAMASMLYVAMADLIPSLHRHTDSTAAMQQVVLIAAGVSVAGLLGAVL